MLSETNRGWVFPPKATVWEECVIKESNESSVTLIMADGGSKQFPKKGLQLCYRNPTAMENSEDFLVLPHLDEPNILQSLRVRYEAGEVYSYTGPILIAVNPWRDVSHLYTHSIMESYQTNKAHAPHIWDVANKAYAALVSKRKGQCVLIAGESGAGKTESTKKVLQLLTAAGENRTKASASIEQQIMLTNPVLESFGNAKTLRNDNSSRFGKWISVNFDRKGTIAGARITTYLLEKARVIGQGEQERNYHIFYQMCKTSANNKMLRDLGFQEPSAFEYTKTWLDAMGQDDEKEFGCTKSALQYIGFDDAKQTGIFSVLAAILHLGNLDIKESGEGSGVEKSASLDAVSRLLEVDTAGVEAAMCNRTISVGSEKLKKPETAEKARGSRDALAKALYHRLFNYLIKGVNESLDKTGDAVTIPVSVLDIFGFEVFKANHFEQFCINFANEKLQLHFNHFNFMLERELYAREGIAFDASDFNDNSKCVELIEAKGTGLLAILDDVCKAPKGDDAMYHLRLSQTPQVKDSKYFTVPKLGNDTFIVHHYAADVTYSIYEFCEKNKDNVSQDLIAMIAASKSTFLPGLFQAELQQEAPASKSGPGRAAAVPTLGSVFKKDLQSLLDAIEAADPHFVRCMNPNTVRKANLFDPVKAMEQLRCGGVIEAVRMARESYPTRMVHAEFVGTFAVVCPSQVDGDPKTACLNIVTKMALKEKQYKLGKTMILLKREAMEALEKERSRLLYGRAISIQCAARIRIAKEEMDVKRETREMYLAIVKLQWGIRRRLQRDKYVFMRANGGAEVADQGSALDNAVDDGVCVCVCVCVCVWCGRVGMLVCTHADLCFCVQREIHVRARARARAHTHTHTHTHTHATNTCVLAG